MKRIPSRAGFTLVELLVVIAIIALLASVITVSATSVINAAKRAKAGNTATQLQTAIVNYFTEYGIYPVPSDAGATDLLECANGAYDAQEQNLIYALCGNINPLTAATAAGTVANSRNIAFLALKRGDVDSTHGLPFNPMSTAAAPQFFSIAMDSDYSGIVGDSGNAHGGLPDFASWTNGGSIKYLNNGLTQGQAVWACCDPKNLTTPGNSTSPQFWIKTY